MLGGLFRPEVSDEARTIRDPGWNLWGRGEDFPLGSNTSAGERVNHETALAMSAVYGCITLRAEALMSMPVEQFRSQGATRQPMSRSKWLTRPNPEMPFWPMFASSLMWSNDTDGNVFVAPVRNEAQQVLEVWPLDPGSVEVRRGGDGKREYWIGGQLFTGELIHLWQHARPGALRGINPILANKDMIANGLAAVKYASGIFSRAGIPSGVIQLNQPATSDQIKMIRENWLRVHGGSSKSMYPAVIANGEYKTVSFDPETMQFLETRRMSAAEVCAIYHVNPAMLGFGDQSKAITYQNVETTWTDLIRRALMGPMALLEAALSSLLPSPQQMRFVPDVYLRPSTKERYETYQIAIAAGIMTVNEVRALENLPPVAGGELPTPTAPQEGGANGPQG